MIKVTKGTRSDNAPRLCDTCSRSLIVSGPANGQEMVVCNATYSDKLFQPPFRVVECSGYIDKTAPDLRDMRDMAWVISTDPKKKFGFMSPKEYKKAYSEEERELDSVDEPYWMK